MKRSRIPITKMLLTTVLTTGVGMFAGSVSAGSEDLRVGYANSSDLMRYAAVNFRGKPAYNRHVAKKRELEKARFARFEEKPDIAKDKHKPKYHGIQGRRPPYRRH